jgi:hypothetical protein
VPLISQHCGANYFSGGAATASSSQGKGPNLPSSNGIATIRWAEPSIHLLSTLL